MSETLVGSRLGFFGKVPARGDFVTRRLLRDFTTPWDGWLQEAIATSSRQLADAWLDTYLTAPIWRFLLSPGVCGEAAVLGVMMPSVDRVGRYFPLTLALPIAETQMPAKTLLGAASWFEAVEALALSALEDDADLDRLDQEAEAIGPPEDGETRAVSYGGERAICIEIEGEATLAAAAAGMADSLLALAAARHTLWWTSGSERMRPALVVAEELPSVEGFSALLDGRWEQWGWKTR